MKTGARTGALRKPVPDQCPAGNCEYFILKVCSACSSKKNPEMQRSRPELSPADLDSFCFQFDGGQANPHTKSPKLHFRWSARAPSQIGKTEYPEKIRPEEYRVACAPLLVVGGVRGYPRHRKHTGNEEISPLDCSSISWIVLNPILREVLAGNRSGARAPVPTPVFTAMRENPA